MRLLVTLALLAGCREVYTDPATGYSVRYNQRHHRGIGLSTFGVIPMDGDRGEPGQLHPLVIEHVFAAPEGPFARYYDLVLALDDRPPPVTLDLRLLDGAARVELPAGTTPRGVDYARALGKKLARSINEALVISGSQFEGSAGVYWGIPVDLDAGIPLLDYERDGEDHMVTTLLRYEGAGLVVLHSTATATMFAWDVSAVPGAFTYDAPLDRATVAARAIALHAVALHAVALPARAP